MRARHSFVLVAGIIASALGWSAGAAAEVVGNYRDWTLYVHQDRDGRLCYIASLPTKQEGNYKQRGQAAAFVSRLPTLPPKEEVSVQPGYTFKQGSEVELVVDETDRFSFFTQGEHAWARTPKDDQSLIAAMKRGHAMVVKGTSSRDTTSTDSYSLAGFTAAFNAMLDTCKDARSSSAGR